MNKRSLLFTVVTACITIAIILSIPLYYSPVLALSGPPLYPVQLRMERSGTGIRLIADTQGKPITNVRIQVSGGLAGQPYSGCSNTGYLLRCSFSASAQPQLVPLFLLATPVTSVQVLPSSSIISGGTERLRQFPTLSPPP